MTDPSPSDLVTPHVDLDEEIYQRYVRMFDRIRKLLGIRLKMHHEHGQIENGDIFLFNHFARMETFIPQYLIYHESGAFCRSVAAHQFFEVRESFANLLIDLGAVPNDHPALLPLLAANILHGRKVVVFPEGGMVKDRRVIDESGEYEIYSRTSRQRRKHHTGPARLAVGLQIFKRAVIERDRQGRRSTLQEWADMLRIDSVYELVKQAHRPVTIIPANITFYPLRVGENLLVKGAEFFRKDLSDRMMEELIVEGNLLLKKTDMDIRLGEPLVPAENWKWWEAVIIKYLAYRVTNPDDVFDFGSEKRVADVKACAMTLRTSIERVRDSYMCEMYKAVTVNLSHLASHFIVHLLDSGLNCVAEDLFRNALYVAIKRVQKYPQVHLHRGLCNPELYAPLLEQPTEPLEQFLRSATRSELIEIRDGTICFLRKLTEDHSFDEVRIENPVEVYANEVEPLAVLVNEIVTVKDEASRLGERETAIHLFDDEVMSWRWDNYVFSRDKHELINGQETATADALPFLLGMNGHRNIGVLLVHGFLASPAEVREFGEKLATQGYTVLGVRLKGHGTSPWDLRERSWEDWLASIERCYRILSSFRSEVATVGFSTGGALGMLHAAARPEGLRGICSVCTPMKYQNKNMRYVPLVHGANKVVRWLSSYEGIVPFRKSESEHPLINYRHMPLRGLYELTRMNDRMNRDLKKVACPVTLIQSTSDHIVHPNSANVVQDLLVSAENRLHWVESARHGILHEDVGETQTLIMDFLASLESTPQPGSEQQEAPAVGSVPVHP